MLTTVFSSRFLTSQVLQFLLQLEPERACHSCPSRDILPRPQMPMGYTHHLHSTIFILDGVSEEPGRHSQLGLEADEQTVTIGGGEGRTSLPA